MESWYVIIRPLPAQWHNGGMTANHFARWPRSFWGSGQRPDGGVVRGGRPPLTAGNGAAQAPTQYPERGAGAMRPAQRRIAYAQKRQSESPGRHCPGPSDAGSPTRIRTSNLLINSPSRGCPPASTSVFFGFPIGFSIWSSFARIRPFSSLWLHDWLHGIDGIEGFLKPISVCVRAYFCEHAQRHIWLVALFFTKCLGLSSDSPGHFMLSQGGGPAPLQRPCPT